jgi:hypothetical protein
MESKRIKKAFITHSSHDENFAIMLDGSLAVAGVETFLYERDVRVGESIPERIYQEISRCSDLIYVISRSSIKSAWVQEELSAAKMQQLDREGFKVLPVLIDDAEIPMPVRHIRYANFTQWREPDAYRQAVLELLQALGVEPVLIGRGQVIWWIENENELRFIIRTLTDLYTRTG